MKNSGHHESVMVGEVLKHLSNKGKHFDKFSRIIDATLGTGGHTEALIDAGVDVLGIEADPKMLEIAKDRLPKANLVQGNFVDLEKIARENGFGPPAGGVDGILFDLGVSNLHLKQDNRGFSFSDDNQELDMRLDTESQGVKASHLLNALGNKELIKLLTVTMKYMEAKRLAKSIVESRPINSVGDLLRIVGEKRTKAKLHPATLPMLALRIAVNSELENLKTVLPIAFDLLKPGGKLLIITFHSAESEIVKNYKKNIEMVLPSEKEILENPRSRSAKLWIIKK